MITNGWICLHRKMQNWEWFKANSDIFKVFVYLIFNANVEDAVWQAKYEIKRGQLIRSVSSICSDTGLTIRAVRTALEHLKKTGEIEIKATNKNSIITICNYDTYQNQKSESDKPTDKPTDNRVTINNITINKKQENINNNLGTYVPLSSETTAAPPPSEDISENLENFGQMQPSEPTLALQTEISEKEKSCAKKEKAKTAEISRGFSSSEQVIAIDEKTPETVEKVAKTTDYKWEDIRLWFNGKVAMSQIPQVRAFNDKRKTLFRKAVRQFGREQVAAAIEKAATVPFLNGDNDRHWTADFDFILNPNKLPRILEGYYDHLHEEELPASKMSNEQYTLRTMKQVYQQSLNETFNNGNETSIITGTGGDAALGCLIKSNIIGNL